MVDRTPDRTAALGLVLLAVLAWVLPPCLRLADRALDPAPPVVYGQAGSRLLLWSPEGLAPAPDGYLAGADGRPGSALGGWQGLLFGIPLDLNRASREDLEALPGVGPKTAASILEARETMGGFGSVKDLLRVRGIGPKTLETLRPLVRVGEETP
jgi:competence ComEA-like helix-hairpin-helix protein